MDAKIIEAQLTERIQRTQSIESFRFKPEHHLDFIPGQFSKVIFDATNEANKELNKFLSFSSSPTNEYFEVSKRLSDSIFSQRLRTLRKGDAVSFKAPFGNCVFSPEYKKITFLAGGIGITPVISIIEYIVEKHIDTDIVLFYSNRTEDDIAFRQELQGWQASHKNIRIIFTVTNCEPKEKWCIHGRINEDLLKAVMNDICSRIFFIYGPSAMVNAMRSICLKLQCNRENIKTEIFIGY